MSQFRAYFYDLDTRKEITEFDGNGKTWLQTSGGTPLGNGDYDGTTCTFVCIADSAGMDYINGERKITAEDFPGRRIAVKIWYSPTNIEWRKLVPEAA